MGCGNKRTIVNPLRFKEHRKDGWPLCPKCGEDELVSALLQVVDPMKPTPSLLECLHHGFFCMGCGWADD